MKWEGWVGKDELATWLITVFETTQGFRGALGANPYSLYVCIRWYWNLICDLASVSHGKKVEMIWERVVVYYCSFEEGLRIIYYEIMIWNYQL